MWSKSTIYTSSICWKIQSLTGLPCLLSFYAMIAVWGKGLTYGQFENWTFLKSWETVFLNLCFSVNKSAIKKLFKYQNYWCTFNEPLQTSQLACSNANAVTFDRTVAILFIFLSVVSSPCTFSWMLSPSNVFANVVPTIFIELYIFPLE